jgi:hypothetical protein
MMMSPAAQQARNGNTRVGDGNAVRCESLSPEVWQTATRPKSAAAFPVHFASKDERFFEVRILGRAACRACPQVGAVQALLQQGPHGRIRLTL